jgi:hypothetical protein
MLESSLRWRSLKLMHQRRVATSNIRDVEPTLDRLALFDVVGILVLHASAIKHCLPLQHRDLCS